VVDALETPTSLGQGLDSSIVKDRDKEVPKEIHHAAWTRIAVSIVMRKAIGPDTVHPKSLKI